MLPAAWKPLPASDLARLGAKGDGGYIVSLGAVKASTVLLSFGLNDDWRFERAFQAESGARVICFDHTVNGRFWVLYTIKQLVRFRLASAAKYLAYRWYFARPDTEHRRIKIGYDGPGQTSVATLMEQLGERRVFLKADIEGSEYRILDDLVANADRFTGMAFEFHDIDLNRNRVEEFLAALAGFRLIDLHANNYGGVDPNGDPIVIELSLVRDEFFMPAAEASVPAKEMHSVNDPTQPEIELLFEPQI